MNGLETFVIYEFREQLEKKLEETNYFGDFEFKDLENIIYKEVVKRNFEKKRNYGKFKKISESSFPIQPHNFFFTKYENLLIEELTNKFYFSNNSNFVLLTGKSAQGKTVLARQIGYNLEKKGFLFLYIELNHAHNFSNLNLEIISNENNNIILPEIQTSS